MVLFEFKKIQKYLNIFCLFFDQMMARPLEVVVGIIWKNRAILVQQRPPNRSFPGFWEFPGGKVEPNESLENALAREIKEELGIEILESSFWKKDGHFYKEKDLHVNLHYFNVSLFRGEPAGLEGQHLFWMTKSANMQGMKFLEADVHIVAELKQKLDPME